MAPSTMTRMVGRHTSSGIPARLARPTSAGLALAIVVLATVWLVGAVHQRHTAESRAVRAAELREVGPLATRERRLVVLNRHHSTPTLVKQIDAGAGDLVSLLDDVGNRSSPTSDVSSLATTYRTAIYLGDSPSHAATAAAALARVRAAAATALAADEQAALRPPYRASPLAVAEIVSSTLILVVGSLLLLWLGLGRPRRRERVRYDAKVEQLAVQALTDSLTQLGNHRAFQDDLTAAIAARAELGQPFTLMAIDLDGLKRINDTKGHPEGDAHIRTVAECLRSVVDDEGTVYRTGGDEFMVILPGRRNWHGLTLAYKIDQETKTATGSRAVSIGLTESLRTEPRHLLVRQADVALYEAKRTRLSAVTYHPGLGVTDETPSGGGPSREQRTLAAALARAVDAKDVGTQSHSETVAQLCVAIGQRLKIPPAELERLRLAGLLHDVGKIGVADAILQKPDVLVPDEQFAMTEHVEVGHAIMLAAELPIEAFWVLHHHERYDGSGYPTGMSGEEIPIQSRIIAVADAFEAMTGTRPYRHEGVTAEEALVELRAYAGTQFDPACVDALVAVVHDAATEGAEPAALSASS